MLVLRGEAAASLPAPASAAGLAQRADDTHLISLLEGSTCSCVGFLAALNSHSQRLGFCLKHHQWERCLQLQKAFSAVKMPSVSQGYSLNVISHLIS